jgi:hypothetical protein
LLVRAPHEPARDLHFASDGSDKVSDLLLVSLKGEVGDVDLSVSVVLI